MQAIHMAMACVVSTGLHWLVAEPSYNLREKTDGGS